MDATISAAWIAAGATVFVGLATDRLHSAQSDSYSAWRPIRREDVRALHEPINADAELTSSSSWAIHERENQKWRSGIVRELGILQGRFEDR